MDLEQACQILTNAECYAEPPRFFEACRLLRREAPVHFLEPLEYRPFWAVTRHCDIQSIERQPRRFLNAPRSILTLRRLETAIQEIYGAGRPALRTLSHMDAPEHGCYRALLQPFLQPEKLTGIAGSIRAVATDCLDQLRAHEGPIDFCETVATRLPLRVLMTLLDLPRDDEAHLLTLTQGLFSPEDPDRRLDAAPETAFLLSLEGFREYLEPILRQRHASDHNDLLTILLEARIDGAPLPEWERFSYLVLLLTAGHDTTSYALAGGMHALLEHPSALDRLRNNPHLVDLAVNEIVRWTSPVRSFMRTATEPAAIGNRRIRKGDALLLLYPSANRDEAVFEDADAFDPGRRKNPHLGFGAGPHFCLGHHLAKLEIGTFLRCLLATPVDLMPAGDPAWSRSTFVGGIKHLPVRCHAADDVGQAAAETHHPGREMPNNSALPK